MSIWGNYTLISQKDKISNYLTFSSPNDFTLSTYQNQKRWNGTMYYSIDTKHWNIWDGIEVLNSNNGNLYIAGMENTRTGNGSTVGSNRWVFTGSNISCSGNIMSLLESRKGKPIRWSIGAFTYLFGYQSAIISAPTLPGLDLPKSCYWGMFRETSIVTPPILPATTLSQSCYAYMFYGCESLTTAPELPATTSESGCYQYMFYGCKSLTTVPELPATTLTSSCYNNMFRSCKLIKLSTIQTGDYLKPYRIPTTGTGTDATNALKDMFTSTGGTFNGTPTINTTYYTSNTII